MRLLVVQPGTPSGNSTGVSSRTFSLTGVTAGNSLVVQFNCESQSQNDAIVFPAGWVVKQAFTPNGYSSAVIAVLNNATAGTNRVTVHYISGTGGGFYYGLMSEVTPLATSPGDLYYTATATGGTLTPTSGGTATSQASEIVFSVISPDLNVLSGAVSQTTPSGFTSIYNETNANNYQTGSSAYKVLTTTQAISAAWTALTTDSQGWVALIWSLKAAASTPTSNPAAGAATITPIGAATGSTLSAAIGSAAITAKGAATAVAIAAAIGSAVVPIQGAGTAQTVNSASGSAQISVTGAARSVAVNTGNGAATITPVGHGTASQSVTNPATGAGTIPVRGAGTAATINAAHGAQVVTPKGAATAGSINRADASGTASVSGAATVKTINPATGAAQITPVGHGTATVAGTNPAVGSATITPTGRATAGSVLRATGAGLVVPSGAASGVAINRGAGNAALTVNGAAYATALNAATAAARITPIGAGTVGTSQIVAAGYGVIPVTGHATGLTINTGTGSGLIVPVGHGTGISGNPYITTPQFYLRMPARSFAVSMPARDFYVAMPARSFYLQDTESMPAQTFPDAMDPAETQPLTIDKTPDLASGETLTALSGTLQVTVTRGNDSAPSTRFGTPVINAAQIPATPPAIPATIAPNMGLQIEATDPQDGCWYLLRQACMTSTGRVVTLKGILQSTSS